MGSETEHTENVDEDIHSFIVIVTESHDEGIVETEEYIDQIRDHHSHYSNGVHFI
jgi:hypothetical protein